MPDQLLNYIKELECRLLEKGCSLPSSREDVQDLLKVRP